MLKLRIEGLCGLTEPVPGEIELPDAAAWKVWQVVTSLRGPEPDEVVSFRLIDEDGRTQAQCHVVGA